MNPKQCRQQVVLTALILAAVILVASFAEAKSCRYSVAREVCPTKNEAELLKPYEGKKELEEDTDVPSLADCLKKAEVASKILRPGQFRSKKVSKIFYDQKSVDNIFEDKKECKE